MFKYLFSLFLACILGLAALSQPQIALARPHSLDVSGTISTNTTWTKTNSPYIVTGNVSVASNVTLTIEPGVVVKFRSTSLSLGQGAQLVAAGTSAEPIVFTSSKDDSYGGDSNGDGSVTVPMPGDWGGLIGNALSSALQLQHVRIRYANTAITTNASLSLSNSFIEQSYTTAVYVLPNSSTAPSVSIAYNTIQGFGSYGIQLQGQPGTLSIGGNTIESNTGSARIYVRNVTSGHIANNTIRGADATGIYLYDVGSNVTVSDNIIQSSGTQADSSGIESYNSAAYVLSNQIRGFGYAVGISSGYPQVVPTYTEIEYAPNDFSNNRHDGIAVWGTLKGGTWTAIGGFNHFIGESVTLESNASLTIPAGTVVKIRTGTVNVNQGAKLIAIGNAGSPIVFTSIKDDSVGGDTNKDGGATLPNPGDWNSVYSNSSLSTLQFQHVVMRYASTGIRARAALSLLDSRLEKLAGTGVSVEPVSNTAPTVLIERTTIENIPTHGEGIVARGQPGTLTIRDNKLQVVKDATRKVSSGYPRLYLENVTAAQIENNTIDALGNVGISLRNVGSSVSITGNTLTNTGSSDVAGVESYNSSPALTSNKVSGFAYAVKMKSGYPVQVPGYSNNDFSGNQYTGVGVGGTLKSGTWSNFGNHPHFFAESALIEAGATLTIPAGSVIKFLNVTLDVGANAKLVAVGSAEAPIVFTSIKDDSVGGDSNNDGAASQPTDIDWSGIHGNNSQGSLFLKHVTIRYAYNPVNSLRAHVTIQDAKFESIRSSAISISPVTAINVLVERTSVLGHSDRSIYIYGQPGSLVLRDNVLADTTLSGYNAIYLYNVKRGEISGNTITAENAPAIYLSECGPDLLISNNVIKHSLDRSQTAVTFAGIENDNSSPQLVNNTISGFAYAVGIGSGYPLWVPSYTGNDFSGNQIKGIGVWGELKSGSWSHAGGHPHFVAETAWIEENATLTIPAGTVVKFKNQLVLREGASFVAQGTANAPVVLTSLQDDSYGGDLNNNGTATLPAHSDWSGLYAYYVNTSITLQNVLLRYAGNGITSSSTLSILDSTIEKSYRGINISPVSGYTAKATIERSWLANNQTGFYIANPGATISLKNNALVGNFRAIEYSGGETAKLDATANWWGSPAGPAAEQISGNIDTASPLSAPPTSSAPGQPTATPTVTVTPPTVTPTPTPTATPLLPVPDSFEADDLCAEAKALTTDSVGQSRNFHKENDVDWAQFNAVAGTSYRIEVQSAPNTRSDVSLEVYNQCGGTLSDSFDESFTPGVRLDFTAQTTGPIFLRLNNHDGTVFGNDVSYTLTVRKLGSTANNGALIIMAGRLRNPDRLQANIHNVTNNVYDFYKSKEYTDDQIFYLATDNKLNGYDAPATVNNLRQAITSWAVSRVGTNRPLTLYLMDHGGIDNFFIDGTSNQEMAPDQLHEWLNQLETAVPGVPITVIIEACHSGSFIDGNKSISKPGRLVIASTNVQNVAYASNQGAHFSDRFISGLRQGMGLYGSFWAAESIVRSLNREIQQPWIDANGNGIPNEPADGAAANNREPGYVDKVAKDIWAPWIVSAQASALIEETATVTAEVRDNKSVKQVWAVVYPPSYQPPTSAQELVPEDLTSFTFKVLGNNQYQLELADLTENGVYRIAIYAEDEDGLKARLQTVEVFSVSTLYLPSIQGQ